MLRRLLLARNAGDGAAVYAKWDSSFKSPLITLSNNDLSAYRSGSSAVDGLPVASVRADVGLLAGKWYFEISTDRPYYTGNAWESAGICSDALDLPNVSSNDSYIGVKANSYGHCYRRYGGGENGVQELRNGTATWVGSSSSAKGVIGIAVDLDTGRAWCIINGAWTLGANPLTAPVGRYTFPAGMKMYPAVTIQDGITAVPSAIHKLNAGQSPFSMPDSAFLSAGALAGFNKGWWRQ